MDREHVDTAAVHAGAFVAPLNPASSPPLFQASSYEFADLDEVEAIYGDAKRGAVYGRYGGPNTWQFEAAIAELEGAAAAAGAASGMAAIDAALAAAVGFGERIVATRECYGGTYALLERDYRPNGRAEVVYVDQSDLDAVAAALTERRSAVLYVEALTNPLIRVADLPALAMLAHRAGARLIVDATFATPVLCRPLEHGADVVVHSVGKYLGGHGDVGAGVLAGERAVIEAARGHIVRRGAAIPHFEAWLALRGIRTLALRMERHSANARAVAAHLAGEWAVAAVHHPSLPGHPQAALAARLYPCGTGGMLAFDLRGGRAAVDRFTRGLRRIAMVHSLGEVATTISYSAASSHRPLPPEVRRALGVGEGTLRLSAGIEAAEDVIADLAQALAGLSLEMRA